ncbi:MAG: hypothetical protein AAAFM81_02580 [Pseudomonadota bacterium]
MRVVVLVLLVAMTGCVSFQDPVPEGYTGETALVKDTFTNHEGSKAHFFVLTEVNGVLTEDSGYRTRVTNQGRGFAMTPDMVERNVTTEPQTWALAGFIQFATDAQAMFADSMLVYGQVEIEPKPGETYEVVGQLAKAGSEIWVVDSSGNVVTDRVVEEEK